MPHLSYIVTCFIENCKLKDVSSTMVRDIKIDSNAAATWLATCFINPFDQRIPLWCFCAFFFCDLVTESTNDEKTNILVKLKRKYLKKCDYENQVDDKRIAKHVIETRNNNESTEIPPSLNKWWESLLQVAEEAEYYNIVDAFKPKKIDVGSPQVNMATYDHVVAAAPPPMNKKTRTR